ncbi:MAG: tyrosine-type recombinase/integrase [Candidatus Aenigmatarchaeota archaeon]|nr:tyrosine-type recombinase/integrase [Nanoarchaeota archaeon]
MSLADLMAGSGKEEARRILTPLEIAEMFQAAEANARDCMLLKCLYYLGLSNSEVQNMQVDDVDFDASRVRVMRGEKKRTRKVMIPDGFGKELKGFVKGKKGPIFSGRSMGLLSDRHIRRIVKSYACKADLQKASEIHPHSLRDSYASHVKSLTNK